MNKKYVLLTSETIKIGGATLYRIKAIRDIRLITDSIVSAGTTGGYVQSEANLSQDGNCWLADDAKAYGKSRITDNALLCDDAEASGRSQVNHDSLMCNNTKVRDCGRVYGTAHIGGCTVIEGVATIGGNAVVIGDMVYAKEKING